MIRFNHVEITVPAGFVAQNEKALQAFFSDIFDFQSAPFPGMTSPYLVFTTDAGASQFLFIAEHATPAVSPGDDHLGFHLDTSAEVDAKLAACKLWRKRDARLEIRELPVLDLDRTITTAFYVRYLLPIWFDVQNIAYKAGCEPTFSWRFAAVSAAD